MKSFFCTALLCAALSLAGCATDAALPIDTSADADIASRRNPNPNPQPNGDERLAGGATTVFLTDEDAFGQPAPNLSPASLLRHNQGDSAFGAEFAAIASAGHPGGLGPIFNHTACEGCHVGDGRGRPVALSGEMNSLLLRISLPGMAAHGSAIAVTGFGGQIQDQAVAGVQPEAKFSIVYTEQPGSFADGASYSLRMPQYRLQNTYLPFPGGALISPRIASPVFGLGLLEAISEQTILSFADPDDRNNDGISGKANYVWDVQSQKLVLGRFGWKSNQPSLLQQNAAAFNGDMGVTTSLFPDESSAGQLQAIAAHTPEVNDVTLNAVVHYTRTLGVPARRNTNDPTVQKGKEIFNVAKCASCHIPSMQTGTIQNVPEISNQPIFPYTDLLVHDMGEGLTDNRSDFAANGREWRTAPLWGIGLTSTVNKHTFFLHDGRARSLMEAVLWHGGEAASSRDYVRKLPKPDREALVKFLESL